MSAITTPAHLADPMPSQLFVSATQNAHAVPWSESISKPRIVPAGYGQEDPRIPYEDLLRLTS